MGEALLRAKVTAGDAEIVKTWVYLGDPTLQLVPQHAGAGCDVNGDGKIDIADLQLLVNVILGAQPCPGSCDINRDLPSICWTSSCWPTSSSASPPAHKGKGEKGQVLPFAK